MSHNAETRIMPTRLPRPQLARRRGMRQGLFTEEPGALAVSPARLTIGERGQGVCKASFMWFIRYSHCRLTLISGP
jgi:hypothetical protein